MGALRVAICDDAMMYGTLLRAQFRDDAEIEVVAVSSTADACLAEIERLQPDVVVLDHILPGCDSTVVMPQLRRRAPRAAVVLISGLPSEQIARIAEAVGAQAAVSKASTREVVRQAILSAAAARPRAVP